MSGILNSIQISSQGLSIQRSKMNIVSENLANAETTRTDDGGPYRRKRVVVSEDQVKGTFRSMMKQAGTNLHRTNSRHLPGRTSVATDRAELPSVTSEAVEDAESSYKLIYDPSHPDADPDGYVRMPDIEIVNEMVDMMAAARAYEANTVAISMAKQMAKDALDI